MMTTCRACKQSVDTDKPEGWGEHRYGCLGPSNWHGMLEGYSNGYHLCHCGEPAVIRIIRGHNDYWACCAEHGRSRKTKRTKERNPFAIFAVACGYRYDDR